MRKKLLLLNALLLGVLILGAAELYRAYLDARGRYELLDRFTDARQPPGFPPPGDPRAVRQADYMPIVERLLFFADRNPIVVVEAPEVEEVVRPALPILSGLVDFGDGLSALMSPAANVQPEWIKVGDKVGEYVFNGLDGEQVKLAWNEEEIVVGQDSLKAREAAEPTRTRKRQAAAGRGGGSAPAGSAAAPQAAANVSGSNQDARVGAEFMPGRFRVTGGDDSPDGTVHKGHVKRVRKTPFGSQSWWEKEPDK